MGILIVADIGRIIVINIYANKDLLNVPIGGLVIITLITEHF